MRDRTDRLRAAVRSVQDFPKPGILFRDLSPLMGDAGLLRDAVDMLAEAAADFTASRVVALDARGFIFGAALAHRMGVGFVPVRKKGKLPHATISRAYELEYGRAEFEIHRDGLLPGEKVLLVDDLLATGGTAAAALHLIRELDAVPLAALFVIELEGLGGREKLAGTEVRSLMTFPA